MGRSLSTPADTVDIGWQCVDSIHFEIPHSYNPIGGAVEITKPSIRVDVTWTNYGIDGSLVSRNRHTLNFEAWPANFVTEANELYAMIETWLENQGFILGTGATETI